MSISPSKAWLRTSTFTLSPTSWNWSGGRSIWFASRRRCRVCAHASSRKGASCEPPDPTATRRALTTCLAPRSGERRPRRRRGGEGRHLPPQPVLRQAVEGAEAVLHTDLLALGVGAAVVRNRDLV